MLGAGRNWQTIWTPGGPVEVRPSAGTVQQQRWRARIITALLAYGIYWSAGFRWGRRGGLAVIGCYALAVLVLVGWLVWAYRGERGRLRRIRKGWPALADALRLTYRDVHGTRWHPGLTGFVRDEHGFRVGVVMVAGQVPGDFQDAAEAIAHAWGVARVEVSTPYQGRVVLRAYLTDPLAVAYGSEIVTRDPQRQDAWHLTVRVGELGPDDEFTLAVTEAGTPVLVSLTDSAHALTMGTTRSGKSISANVVLANASVRRAVRVFVIDPNAVAAAPWYRTAHRVSLDTHPAAATEVLREIRAEMEARKHLLVAGRTDRLTGFTDTLPLLLVVIDEVANYTRHPDKAAAKAFEAELIAIASQGAKFGVRLWLYAQKPSSEVVSTAIRANLSARICFRVDTIDDFLMAFPEGRELPLTAADRSIPAGVGIASVGEMTTPTRVRGVYLPTEACWAVSDALCQAGRKVRDEQAAATVRVLGTAGGAA
jgi:S-DNA-T family DNA segregation ATPase FtsK/SpoIIIE